MLPLTHVFPVVRKDKVSPLFYRIDEKNLAFVGELLETARELVGSRRKEVLEQLGLFHGEVSPQVLQGLVKLILNRAEFGVELIEDPVRLRHELFDRSVEYWRNLARNASPEDHHRNILSEASLPRFFHETPIEDWLYCDVESNRLLRSLPPIDPQSLVNEFNVAQAQGILMQSATVRLTLRKSRREDLRMFMQQLKFFGLLFEIKEQTREVLRLEIGGASSVVENARAYGVSIAKLFPVMINLSNPWLLEADVFLRSREKTYRFAIDEKHSYLPVRARTGVFRNELMGKLVERWNEKHARLGRAFHSDELIILRDNLCLMPDLRVETENAKRIFRFEWLRYPGDFLWKKTERLLPLLPDDYFFLVKGKAETLPASLQGYASKFVFHRREPLAGNVKQHLLETLQGEPLLR